VPLRETNTGHLKPHLRALNPSCSLKMECLLVRFRRIVPRYTIVRRLFATSPCGSIRTLLAASPPKAVTVFSYATGRTITHLLLRVGKATFFALDLFQLSGSWDSDTFFEGELLDVFSAVNFRIRRRGDTMCCRGLVLSGSAWPLFRRAWTGDGSAVCPNKTQDVAGDGAGSLAHSRLQFGGLPFCAVRPVRPCFLTSIVSSWKRLLPSLLIIREILFPAH
jgi:hypothetical protein